MIRRLLDLVDRYVRATEQIAAAQEAAVQSARTTADAMLRSVEVNERAQQDSAINVAEVTAAVQGLRAAIEALMGRLGGEGAER